MAEWTGACLTTLSGNKFLGYMQFWMKECLVNSKSA
jgi:hypothetical protein